MASNGRVGQVGCAVQKAYIIALPDVCDLESGCRCPEEEFGQVRAPEPRTAAQSTGKTARIEPVSPVFV